MISTTLAFLAPAPCTFTSRLNVHSHFTTQRYQRRSSSKSFKMTSSGVTLSPQARKLFELQVENPLFNPSLLPESKVREAIEAVQPPNPPYSLLSDTSSIESENASLACGLFTEDAVGAAREAVLNLFEGIDQPGGKLYPEYRSDACWRDLLAFTRVAGYLCACQGEETGLSSDGFNVLQKVYTELEVPVDAVIAGVMAIWAWAICKVTTGEIKDVKGVCSIIDKAFNCLVSRLLKLA